MEKIKQGFTIIEILVVATIIGLLAAATAVSYSTSVKGARDTRRQTDLEQIRTALEQFRATNNYYPTGNGNASSALSALTTPTVYIGSIPSDPKSASNYLYYYTALPSGCDNSATPCTSYTVAARLESSSTTCSSSPGNCVSSPATTCNYCLGPYGSQ